MIVTIQDYGSTHGGFTWSNPRTDEGEPLEMSDFTGEEHEQVCDAIGEQVRSWVKRPLQKTTYEFQVKETWRA